mgnify:CR=1 FL=1
MKTLATYKKGISILGIVIFGFVVILVLSYYNISIRGVVESPTGQDNINYVAGTSQSFWNKYLANPASYLWNDIWVDIFWKGFINNMEKIRDGSPTDFDNAVPSVNINNTGN